MEITRNSLLLCSLFCFSVLLSCNRSIDIDRHDLHDIQENIATTSNIIYKTIDSTNLHLDIYAPAKRTGAEPWVIYSDTLKPTLVYFHGGGWVSGDRTSRMLGLLPYLRRHWCVVNVDYRLLLETDLSGCIEDCRDALDWVYENAVQYRIDTSRIVVSGESAGGHLALMVGLADQSHRVAGIVNWYGITDLADAVAFWDDPSYTELIIQNQSDRIDAFYEEASPVNYLTENAPPILSVHGTEDINVPLRQAIKLHDLLQARQLKHKLIQIPGKKHGGFSAGELGKVFETIWRFLDLDL